MGNGFQVTISEFEVLKTSNLFCLVPNGPILILVVCLGLIRSSMWSLRIARAFLEAFWTFMSHLGHTVPASCAHGIPKQIMVNG